MTEGNELAGKVAIVTGAGRNIGRAIALTLARAGASVLVNARSNRTEADAVAREIESAGGSAMVHIGDVADAKAMAAMADTAVAGFGRIDILVNNAALRREKPFAEMDYAEWREILDAGIVGLTRALANDLAADGITVNCVVPGLIGTPRPKGQVEPAHHLTHQTITGERGRPEDVAAVVRFLCSPGARYMTGQAIHANGGAYFGA